MFSPYSLFAVVVGYMAILLLLGLWTEHRVRHGADPTDNGLVYALSLTVYCSSWTFYGSVGSAANSGMLYSAIYVGPTLVMLFAWGIVRRMIRLKERFKLTSVADFLSTRYNRSLPLAALLTLFLCVGLVPYVGLQIRSVVSSFSLLSIPEASAGALSPAGHYLDETLVALSCLLTIVFGLRRLDPSERQHGLVAVLAVESVVKLVAFLAVGIFVTYGLFGGLADVMEHVDRSLVLRAKWLDLTEDGQWYMTWMTYLVLSMSAILFLPRMFHVAVVENRRESHLRTSMWLLPLYLLAISFFVLPIAVAGQVLEVAGSADQFLLSLPLAHGGPGLALLAYLGGFSAAIGMIMVTCTALAVMVSNYLALPLIERLPALHATRRHIRPIRWAAAVGIIWLGYWFERDVADTYLLIQMGLISFAAVLQLAPLALGALYWSGGSRTGALWGLAFGASVWAYTLLLPALIRSIMPFPELLTAGPAGIALLRPEALFGLASLPPLVSSVFWSMLANVSGYVLGSLLRPPQGDEAGLAGRFTEALDVRQNAASTVISGGAVQIELGPKLEQIRQTLGKYLSAAEASRQLGQVTAGIGIAGREFISGGEFLELSGQIETILAGVIGSAMAHRAMNAGVRLTAAEQQALNAGYAAALAEMRISPEELRRRIDYFKSLHEMMSRHSTELSEKLHALELEMRARELADAALRESEDRFLSLADDAPVLIWMAGVDAAQNFRNRTWLEFTGRRLDEESGDRWTSGIHPDDRAAATAAMNEAFEAQRGFRFEFRLRRHDGEYRWIRAQGIARFAADGRYLGFLGTGIDITDMKAAEATLQRSKDELEALVGERTQALEKSLAEVKRVNARLEEAQGQLLQSEKMASIGQLAAGVAHEINNPVGFVTSNLGSLQKYIDGIFRLLDTYAAIEGAIADAGQRAAIEAVKREIDLDYVRADFDDLLHESQDGLKRVRQIVKDLKDFSHVDESGWLPADINAGLDSTLNVVWNELKYKAEVIKDYGPLPEIECIAAQINQVFMNLLVNAAQAIVERGTITLRTRHEGDWVRVEVADTGKGIAAENLQKIFDPFFTTKPVGKGTGLGLSLAFGIMRKHGGRIDVSSTLGEGTRFSVWIPVQRVTDTLEAVDGKSA